MFSHILKFLIFSTFLQYHSYASGLAIDDVIIKSDHLLVNKEEGRAYFTGNVVVWFDDAMLKTTKIIIALKDGDKKRELEKIIFPAKLTAMKDGSNEMIIADNGEYIASENLLTFKGNIYMQKGERLVKCNELKYFTKIKEIKTREDNTK